ncbi:histidinol-phosphate transaminase [Lentisphaerota bacterium WC36G]|nr:histidinol-phosphate transaminase [Lentisphaerae bacterium WC36]
MKNSYFRSDIENMTGYVPGAQPQFDNIIKLNTNENAYAPSPKVFEVIKNFDVASLRKYPDPVSLKLRQTVAKLHGNGFNENNVIIGNGSDDILTMIFRSFTSNKLPFSCVNPTYSLYFELAEIQGTEAIKVSLDKNNNFAFPEIDDLLKEIKKTNMFILPRPNAPTGNSFSLEKMREICRNFEGIVVFDEAYADFAEDNCLELVNEFDNCIVTRTLSKSYSLAGIRLGYAIASEKIIEGMNKVRDSYNIDAITQSVAIAALEDQEYFVNNVKKIKSTRHRLAQELTNLGFTVLPSQTNFLFVIPPDRDGERYYKYLYDHAIITRYFSGEVTKEFVRISIGSNEEVDSLLKVTKTLYC